VHRFGNLVIAVQPARHNIDPTASYHPLPPPHGYLAFWRWRTAFDARRGPFRQTRQSGTADEALALSADVSRRRRWGTAALLPFIVNIGGSQAKRRAPPGRRRSPGAADPGRSCRPLHGSNAWSTNITGRRRNPRPAGCCATRSRSRRAHRPRRDCGVGGADDSATALGKLDSHLCELKEMQIRDGLHVFGRSPAGELLTDLLVALARTPRGTGAGADASLLRALARDLGLGPDFDPLAAELAAPWTGPRPAALSGNDPWRTAGDTVERLEALARRLVGSAARSNQAWSATRPVLDWIDGHLRPTVRSCGAAEIKGLLAGLDGRFVAPGPSGAPTRGRPEVLPTGRNFYSVDTRVVPTPAAWQLGWKSASLLLDRHRQDHGAWPKALALSAWGTANMRTGGDDIAQALALMGVRPTWDVGSGRVSSFEVLPLSVLDRPRVDVTLRVSGFFRDAFPAQIDLVDSAVRAVAALDEPEDMNPLAARVRGDAAALVATGLAPEAAARRAGFRVFGSQPGAYGAGLQALIDERGWESAADLARAYVAWGGYAYGSGAAGAPEHRLFETRLAAIEGVLHNQDNREHDLLDSDDYSQFEGGLAAAVTELGGRRPAIYHNDHSRPETRASALRRGNRARRARPRRQPEMDRRRMRHVLQGALRAGGDGRLPVRLRGDQGLRRRPPFRRAAPDAHVADDACAASCSKTQPDAAPRWPNACSRRTARGGCARTPPMRGSRSSRRRETAVERHA
jgi:cobaltochelatase CobN